MKKLNSFQPKQQGMKYLPVLIIAAFFWACSPQATVDLEAEKAALKAAAEAYHAAAGVNVDDLVPFYTSDAKVLPPDGEVISGTESIRQFVQGFKALRNFQPHFEAPEVEISADASMGYSLASAVLSFEDADGKAVSEAVRDFHVWKKVDGKWKLAVDIWNSPAPPPPAAAEESEDTPKSQCH